MPRNTYLEDVSTSLEAVLREVEKTPALKLLEVLPSRADLRQLRRLAEELLDFFRVYRSFLLSEKYSGRPLSAELIAAMKKAGIEPTVEADHKKPTKPNYFSQWK